MTHPVLSAMPSRLRVAALAIGVGLLLWLPFEDTNVNAVLLFSATICGWWVVRFLAGLPASAEKVAWRHALPGTLGGLAVSPLAILLMAVKTGLHGHPSPDFTPEQLHVVLASTPAWMAAGFLLGLGGGLCRAYREPENARSS
jgi:apolipoprotein N-acyltransferase